MTFARLAILAVCFVAVVESTAEERFRVVLVRAGRADINIRLEDVNDGAVDVPFGSKLTVTAHNGEVRRITADEFPKWQRRIVIDPMLSAIPEFEVRSDNRLWPDDVTVTASLQPPNGAEVPAKPLVIPVPPHPLVALALALLGAVLLALLPLSQVTATPVKKAATIGAALVAGTIAFFAADSKTIWKFVGFQDETPLRPQSYFLLGIAISAIGVRPLIEKITGSKPVSALTPEKVRDEVVQVLSGDTVRAPFREELQAALFDEKYFHSYPELLPRVEAALAAAKYEDVPDDLAKFLSSRLHQVHTQSHREGVKMHLELKTADDWFEWTQRMSYTFVRASRDRSTDPEVRFSSLQAVPPALIGVSGLTSFGPMVLSLEIAISHDELGELRYRGVQGQELVIQKALPSVPSPLPIPVEFTLSSENPDEPEMTFGYDFTFPESFRNQGRVAVELVGRWRAKIDDGIMSVRFARLTNGYFMTYQLAPLSPPDVLVFEWRTLWEQYRNDEVKNGVIDLPRWLLPGNGVCLGWRGTHAIKMKGNDHRTTV